jgi:NADP-dependent 3-hydroxy acid dehydrogenase YdfG
MCGKLSAQAVAIKCDVSNREQVHDAAEKSRQSFGDVTILVNNAGKLKSKIIRYRKWKDNSRKSRCNDQKDP